MPTDNYQKSRYPDSVIDKISEMSPYINFYSKKYGVPNLAVAGAIAEEYATRFEQAHGLKGLLDVVQDFSVPQVLAEAPTFPNTEMLSGIFNFPPLAGIVPESLRSPGFLKADVGPANIGMRTAVNLFERYPNEFPDFVTGRRELAAYAISDQGTAQLSALYIRQAQTELRELFSGTPSLSQDYKSAEYIDYFRQGPDTFLNIYSARVGYSAISSFLSGVAIPTQSLPRPYSGVRAINNQDQLYSALGK